MQTGLIALIILQAAAQESSPFTTERIVTTLVSITLAVLNLVQFRAKSKTDQGGFIHDTDTATIGSLKEQVARLKEDVAQYKTDAEELPKVRRELSAHMSINATELLNFARLIREKEAFERECGELRLELLREQRKGPSEKGKGGEAS
jgi:cell shape-determining protein MreC